MASFVNKNSIVRQIWGRPDTILFIFAGAAAEFALNKAVDWLYFTGRLPADPLGRLFSTVTYARRIIFSDLDEANQAISQITAIHKNVEQGRGAQIPAWAYRDVLFMLIYYSISSFEVLDRRLSDDEKAEVFDVFYRVGKQMGLDGLPVTYAEWLIMHDEHLINDTIHGKLTDDLYKQYKKHLGPVRYRLLRQVQLMIVPDRVSKLLSLGNIHYLAPVLWLYKLSRKMKLDAFLIEAVLPNAYKVQLKALNQKRSFYPLSRAAEERAGQRSAVGVS